MSVFAIQTSSLFCVVLTIFATVLLGAAEEPAIAAPEAHPEADATAGTAADDEVALLQGSVAVQARAAFSGAKSYATVPLQKQYVPISRNGSVIAYKTSYFGRIHAGSPERQTFTVVFDTGSGHLIFPSTGCVSDTCSKHRQYNRTLSDSAVDVEHTGKPISPWAINRDQLKISFGSGEVTGEFVKDRVCLGVSPGPEACVELRIVVANKMSEEPFGLFEFDGVLGLGLSSLALNPYFSFFDQLVQQNPMMQPHFAVFLARDDTGRSGVSFGGHDPRWAASDIEWAPVAMPDLGYWQVQIKSVYIGNTELDDCAAGGCRAILDTGTSLLGVPKQSSRMIHRLLARPVPGEHDAPERSQVDCRTVPGEQMRFELEGGMIVNLAEEDYSRPQPINMTSPELTEGWELFCRSLLLPVDMKPPMGPLVFIWGEPVLRKYLTLYDWSKQQIGFSLAGTNEPEGDAANPSFSSPIGAPPTDSLAAGVPLSKGDKAAAHKQSAGNATAGNATAGNTNAGNATADA